LHRNISKEGYFTVAAMLQQRYGNIAMLLQYYNLAKKLVQHCCNLSVLYGIS